MSNNAAATLYKCTPRQARKYIIDCLDAGLVPFLQSSPGMGKSSIVRAIAKDYNMALIDHRLSTSEPTDLTGLPRFDSKGMAHFAPFADLFPLEGAPLPRDAKGKEMNGWILFLDEANSAPKSVQAAAYKLVLDRMVGQYRLHPAVSIVMAGNLVTDRAIVNPLSTAMQSRVVHLELEVDFQEWLLDVAIPQKYDQRIIAFLSQFEGKLMDFRPDHHDRTFCCPRTWEFVNRLITKYNEDGSTEPKPLNDDSVPLLAGTITSGVALEFVRFSEVFHNLVPLRAILEDPENCRLPSDLNLKWATLTNMLDKVNVENFGKLATYANRLDMSFRVVFYRQAVLRKPELRTHPDYGSNARQIAAYMT